MQITDEEARELAVLLVSICSVERHGEKCNLLNSGSKEIRICQECMEDKIRALANE